MFAHAVQPSRRPFAAAHSTTIPPKGNALSAFSSVCGEWLGRGTFTREALDLLNCRVLLFVQTNLTPAEEGAHDIDRHHRLGLRCAGRRSRAEARRTYR